MRGIVLALLGLIYVAQAKKHIRTGDVPVGFDTFSLEESSNNSNEHEAGDSLTQLARKVVAIEQPTPEALQKEREELELARTLEWEQQKIQELKRERERIRQQKKQEIERIMKEQAIEQARIEAARAQRKRMRLLEEQRRKLLEAKRERERQEKMLAEMERQRQEEIRRLEEEKERQRLKLEEERRRILEEEQRRKKEEEEQRRREEEEEERKRWLEEERKRVEREQEEERRRVEQEQEERRRQREEEEEERRRQEAEEEERRRQEEEQERKRVLEEEERRRQEEEEKRRKVLEEQERRKQEEEEERRKEIEEQERRKQEEEKKRREELEAQERLRQRRIEEEERRRIEEDQRRIEIEKRRLQAQRTTFLGREQLRAELKEENRENSYRISSTRKIPEEIEDKVAKRHRELMARFGNQALASNSNPTPEVRESSRITGGNVEQENELQQGNFNAPYATSVNVPRAVPVSRYAEDNNVELKTSDVVEKYPAPIDFNTQRQTKKKRKTRRRKLRRKLHGIKTLRSSVKSKQMKEPLMKKQFSTHVEENTPATFLGGWAEPGGSDVNKQHYVKVFPTTTPTPLPSKTLAVVVQPVLSPESNPDDQYTAQNTLQVVNVPQLPDHFNEEQYLKAYYEQYYNEWYKQHNEASAAPSTSQMPQRRKLKIQFGSNRGYSQTPKPYSTLDLSQQQAFAASASAPQPNFGGSVQVPLTNTGTLSRDQLDKICIDIQKTTRSFGIKDPKTFALNNCPLIKMYYRQVTCEQINHVMDYCERSSFLA